MQYLRMKFFPGLAAGFAVRLFLPMPVWRILMATERSIFPRGHQTIVQNCASFLKNPEPPVFEFRVAGEFCAVGASPRK